MQDWELELREVVGQRREAGDRAALVDALVELAEGAMTDGTDEAVDAASEAVPLAGELGDEERLMAALNMQYVALTLADRPAEATAALETLIGWLRRADDPDDRLAGTLRELGGFRARAGDTVGGLEALTEAALRYAELPDQPGFFAATLVEWCAAAADALDHLDTAVLVRAHDMAELREHWSAGVALHNLAVALVGVGRAADALPAAELAAGIFRRLAPANLDRHGHEFGLALSTLGRTLGDLGRHQEQSAVAREAVALNRVRAGDLGYTNLDLADALNNLAVASTRAGDRDEAQGVAAEAVAIYRRLAEDWPEEFTARLELGLATQREAA